MPTPHDLGTGFQGAISKVASLGKDHVLGAALGIGLLLIAAFIAVFASTSAVRITVRKLYYLTRNAVTADRGWRDALYWIIITLLVALPLAFVASFHSAGGGTASPAPPATTFDWSTFVVV